MENNVLKFVNTLEVERILSISDDPIMVAKLFANVARINTLYMIKKAGSGHIGTSFSSIDIVSWLYLNELKKSESSIYFSSKGHDVPALYSVLISLGLLRFDLIHKLRKIDGLPGHPDIKIPFMHTNSGSLGMGISKAKGMVLANRLKGKKQKIFVLTGDGELQEGQIWESLQSASNNEMSEITVFVDHNKVQSDYQVSKTSDLGDLESKFKAFGWNVVRCDGNDFSSISDSLEKSTNISNRLPTVIIADTIKGNGVSFMEHTVIGDKSRYMYHSGAPTDQEYTEASDELISAQNILLNKLGEPELNFQEVPITHLQVSTDKKISLMKSYSDALIDQADKNPNIVAMDADLILDSGLIPFKESFPDRYFQCGIAEQDMVSQAGGMALNGLLPVVNSFACFLSDRPNEQIYNNATEKTKIIYVGGLAGVIPGGTGHSHQSVRDIAALNGIPDLIMIEPYNEVEVQSALDFCVNNWESSSYIRLTPLPCTLSIDYEFTDFQLGQGTELVDGDEIVLFSYGPNTLEQAVKASKKLESKGIALKVINLPWLNFVDIEWLKSVTEKVSHIVTLDNHYRIGGQGDYLASKFINFKDSKKIQFLKLGLDNIPECGTNEEVLRAHRMDADNLAVDIENFFNGLNVRG
tara:strand:- start:2790 stop:4706 length:1917 start_codon:yes stop_codon:yes gene_type:complete